VNEEGIICRVSKLGVELDRCSLNLWSALILILNLINQPALIEAINTESASGSNGTDSIEPNIYWETYIKAQAFTQ
jgi:hypothetical protein